MEILVAILSVGLTILGGLWSVVWAIIVGCFWIVLALIALLCIIAIRSPEALKDRQGSVTTTGLSIETIRAALKSGELDADVERVNLRNDSRRRR